MKGIGNEEVFLALMRAGLWADVESTELRIQGFKDSVDWEKVYQLAEEQSVLGVVLAGIEHSEVKPPRELLLQWIGEVQLLEQQNLEMNQFIAKLIKKLRKEDVYAILLKGQGIAQCYEHPMWRCCGDVDLLLSDKNYQKSKTVLTPLASSIEPESIYGKHLGLTINSWAVELHATQHTELSSRIDKVIDSVKDDLFCQGNVRIWMNDDMQVFLPSPDNDVIIVFTHFLKHFYKGGLGLRQICDWCRLLWTFKDSLDRELLDSRIRRMGLMSEWKAFYNLASRYLGMPDLDSGFMFHDSRFDKKADRIMEFVLMSGNMGHNRGSWLTEHGSWLGRQYMVRKTFSMFRRIDDLINHARIFPLDSLRFFPYMMINGVRSAMKGV